MPAPSARYSRALTGSPPLSTHGSQAPTVGGGPAIKVVTRLALEGKAKNGQDGASMRMYLKMSLPVENAAPGSTIALFPEENIKILNSQVHPLDNNSAPYTFSSATSPLLHNAARELNLPARSSQSYLSLFNLPYSQSPPSLGNSSRSSSSNGANPPLLEEKYTGHVLVTGYQVSYVLPKEFPPRYGFGGMAPESERDDSRGTSFSSRRISRRGSVGERPALQFMAAIEIWVPLLTKPPRAPYLLSIPVPRCLSNTLQLRIFPPTSASASFASLSSADDEGQWDLTCHPHLTRNASRHSRGSSYAFSQFADDESSDSSAKAGYSEGSGLQGTFQSTDRIRIRWARAADVPRAASDGRRRVGVVDAKGEMTCAVLGKGKARDEGTEGTLVRLEYKGTCKNVWFGGVATLLGLDVGVEAKECEMRWAEGIEPGWTVTGEAGFTGWDVGEDRSTAPKKPFIDPDAGPSNQSNQRMRVDSAGSSTSLLRGSLPANHVTEYSFESAASTPMSSTASLPPPSPGLERSITPNGIGPSSDAASRPPGVPITLHVNMDDLLPPTNRNNFIFQISGTVLILSRNAGTAASVTDGADAEGTIVSLPRFSVLSANTETVQVLVRNEAQGAALEVLPAADDPFNAQMRKAVLQRGAHVRCGPEGARVALRPAQASPLAGGDGETPARRRERSLSRPTTPVRRTSVSGEPSRALSFSQPTRPKRGGPLVIPYVDIEVTLSNLTSMRNAYSVRVILPAPDDPDSDWLEFGLSKSGEKVFPEKVRFACASVDGVPMRVEVAEEVKAGLDRDSSATENTQEWLRWIKVHTAGHAGARVQIDYTVYPPLKHSGEGDAWPYESLLLPVFALPSAHMEIRVEKPRDCVLGSNGSSFFHWDVTPGGGLRFRNSRNPEFFHPRVRLRVGLVGWLAPLFRLALRSIPHLLSFFLIIGMLAMRSELQDLRRLVGQGIIPTPAEPMHPAEPAMETITRISTHYTHPPWASEEPAVLVDQPPAPSAAESPSLSPSAIPPHTPDEPIPSPFPTPATDTSMTTVILPSPTPTVLPPPDHTRDARASTGLIPFYEHFPWTLKLDWDLPTSEDVNRVVVNGLGKVWQAFRRVYHYPLPPP